MCKTSTVAQAHVSTASHAVSTAECSMLHFSLGNSKASSEMCMLLSSAAWLDTDTLVSRRLNVYEALLHARQLPRLGYGFLGKKRLASTEGFLNNLQNPLGKPSEPYGKACM